MTTFQAYLLRHPTAAVWYWFARVTGMRNRMHRYRWTGTWGCKVCAGHRDSNIHIRRNAAAAGVAADNRQDET